MRDRSLLLWVTVLGVRRFRLRCCIWNLLAAYNWYLRNQGPFLGSLFSSIRQFKDRLKWKLKDGFIKVGNKSSQSRQAVNRSSCPEEENDGEQGKTHTLCVKLTWISATWQGGGSRKRSSKSKVPEKASIHPMEVLVHIQWRQKRKIRLLS